VVEALVNFCGFGVGGDGAEGQADGGLGFFNGRVRSSSEQSENARPEAGGDAGGDEDGFIQDVGVDLVEDFVALRDAAGVDDAVDADAVLGHALENDARMECGAFDGREELVLRGVDEVPAKGDAAEFGVDEDCAVAVVPADAEQAGLAGLVGLEPFRECGDGGVGAAGDGVEDIACSREAGFDAGVAGMDAAGHDTADAGNEFGLAGHGNDAGGGADDVDGIAFADVGADGVPVRVECAYGDGDAGAQAEGRGPFGRKMAGELVAGEVFAAELGADAGEEGVDGDEKVLRRQAVPLGIPHPLVAHGADAALDVFCAGDVAERGGDHVAVLERSNEVFSSIWIGAQPVKKLGEAPLVGVDAAAPLDAFKSERVSSSGDELGFLVGAMVAPEVVVVEGFEVFADGNHAGAGGVEGHGCNGLAIDASGGEDVASSGGQGGHLVGVGLGGEVGIVAAAVERVRGSGGADGTARAVDKGDAHAESAEVNAGDDGHGTGPPRKRFLFALQSKSFYPRAGSNVRTVLLDLRYTSFPRGSALPGKDAELEVAELRQIERRLSDTSWIDADLEDR